MAFILIADIPNMSSEQYRQLHSMVMEAGRPDGMISHCGRVKGSGISIIDIWESKPSVQAFLKERLMPAMESLGIDGEPDVLLMTDLVQAIAFDYGKQEKY